MRRALLTLLALTGGCASLLGVDGVSYAPGDPDGGDARAPGEDGGGDAPVATEATPGSDAAPEDGPRPDARPDGPLSWCATHANSGVAFCDDFDVTGLSAWAFDAQVFTLDTLLFASSPASMRGADLNNGRPTAVAVRRSRPIHHCIRGPVGSSSPGSRMRGWQPMSR